MEVGPRTTGRQRRLLVGIAGAALALASVSVSAKAQSQAANRSADEAAVRALVARYVEARELRDPKAVEALFAADADQYTTSGEWRRGQAAIVSGTSRSSQQNPGARRIRVEAVRFVTADVAIADGPYEIATASASAAGASAGAVDPRRMWTSIVAVRQADGWRIAAIRNMRPSESPRQ